VEQFSGAGSSVARKQYGINGNQIPASEALRAIGLVAFLLRRRIPVTNPKP